MNAWTPKGIMMITGAWYGYTLEELASDSRFAPLAHARHVAAYMAYDLARTSYPQIGTILGGRDHSTAMHSVNLVRRNSFRGQPWEKEIADVTLHVQNVLTKGRGKFTQVLPEHVLCPECDGLLGVRDVHDAYMSRTSQLECVQCEKQYEFTETLRQTHTGEVAA